MSGVRSVLSLVVVREERRNTGGTGFLLTQWLCYF